MKTRVEFEAHKVVKKTTKVAFQDQERREGSIHRREADQGPCSCLVQGQPLRLRCVRVRTLL
jgi:hypothetical protein